MPHFQKCFALSAWVLTLLLSGVVADAQVTYQRLFSTHDSAPGVADGTLFSSFSSPVINGRGEVAFNAFLIDSPFAVPDLETGQALFGPTTTGLSLIARSDQPAPGVVDGAELSSMHNLVLRDSHLSFRAIVRTGTGGIVNGDNDEANYLSLPTSGVELVARKNGPSPGVLGDTMLDIFLETRLSNTGQYAFNIGLHEGADPPVTSLNDGAIFGPTAGGLGIIAQEGSPAPGVVDGAEFNTFGGPVLNDAGQVAFRAGLRAGEGGDPVGFSNDKALFGPTPSGLGMIAREGSPAPGLTDGANFVSLNSAEPVINSSGDVAFKTTLTGGSQALFGPIASGLGVIARGGELAPDVADGAAYEQLLDLVLNDRGEVAFITRLQTGNGPPVSGIDAPAIFGPTPDGLGVIARSGDPAPGVTDDALIGLIGSLGADGLLINNRGDVVFEGPLRDGPSNSVNASNDRAIYAYIHELDELFLVAREGDLFDLGAGASGTQVRTISGFEIVTGSSGSDGRASSLNDLGQLVFELSFTDSSHALIVATLNEDTLLPGDYNEDGTVDAADYVVWRDNLGAPPNTLPNDIDGGMIGQAQYDTWKANFGATAPAALRTAAIPEPCTHGLLSLGALVLARIRNRKWLL